MTSISKHDRRGATVVLSLGLVFGLAMYLGFVGCIPAQAHVVYGTTTLRMLTLQSDQVARVRILDPDSEIVLEEPFVRETILVAEVLESLKGDVAEGPLRFAQHGHGTPKYEKDEEVVLFLQRIERNRELAGSPVAGHVSWVSVQEAAAKFPVDDATRVDFSAAIRSYAALEELSPEQQQDVLRRITVDLLASHDPRLASSAVRDVALMGGTALFTSEDVLVLGPMIDSAYVSIGVRVGLLAELERAGLVEGPPRWARLLGETSGRDRFTVVRAVSAHPSPAVTQQLVALLASDDPLLVSTAAVSLGVPGNDEAVAPLSKLLDSDSSRVRMSAIRGLGRIGTPSAQKALKKAAASHADPETRRRADAELRILAKSVQP